MNNYFIFLYMGILILLIGGCATPIPAPEPASMVPKYISTSIPSRTSIYVEKPTLGSAAKDCKAPFDEITGTFPFVQPRGITNYQASLRLALVAGGAQAVEEPEKATYILRTVVLGGMIIPFPQAYSILFVHYQLEDASMGHILWSKNIYSQAKMEKTGPQMGDNSTVDPAYGRLVAANLRQMMNSMSTWLTEKHNQTGN